MKKLILCLLIGISLSAGAQQGDEIKPAAKGVVYGAEISGETDAISTSELQAKMAGGVFEGRLTGKVTEVCKSMGCWIKLQKEDGSTLMVKSKDHAFFMPQELVGRTVVVEGKAMIKEVSEEKRRHLAEDAGMSKKQIKKIKGSEKQVQFIASGIKVLD